MSTRPAAFGPFHRRTNIDPSEYEKVASSGVIWGVVAGTSTRDFIRRSSLGRRVAGRNLITGIVRKPFDIDVLQDLTVASIEQRRQLSTRIASAPTPMRRNR